MPTYPFMQVDAFTDRPLGGNPCAILFETDDMDETTMLAIAREMNLSETAFVRRSSIANFGARYFTPAEEIPLAGHPTIATVYALAITGRLLTSGMLTTITLELKAGVIPVEVHVACDIVRQIVMSQVKPQFLTTYTAAQVAPIFKLEPDDILHAAPIQTVSTGTPQLMIPLRTLEALQSARLEVELYQAFRARSDFFGPHLFCLEGITPAGSTFARHFGTPPDLMEDPFTGSATGGMAAYLWRYGLIQEPTFIAEQGHWMDRPGQASVEVIGQPEEIETVKVGGGAVVVLRGELVI